MIFFPKINSLHAMNAFKLAHTAACRLEDIDRDLQKAAEIYKRDEFERYIHFLCLRELLDQTKILHSLKQTHRNLEQQYRDRN